MPSRIIIDEVDGKENEDTYSDEYKDPNKITFPPLKPSPFRPPVEIILSPSDEDEPVVVIEEDDIAPEDKITTSPDGTFDMPGGPTDTEPLPDYGTEEYYTEGGTSTPSMPPGGIPVEDGIPIELLTNKFEIPWKWIGLGALAYFLLKK